jgi:hypothetical protein
VTDRLRRLLESAELVLVGETVHQVPVFPRVRLEYCTRSCTWGSTWCSQRRGTPRPSDSGWSARALRPTRRRDRAPQLLLQHPALLAVGLLDDDSAGTGTVIRPDTVRSYAIEAGFTRVDVRPIEHDFRRFYRLVP